jgi:CheY-like chemotaxis protein
VPHTLLLADDSVTIQRVIELTFADEDINVVAVSDGDQAIERLDAAPPDIVLADIGMPGKNGYEVAQYVRQSPKLSHIPVVLLTGAFEPVDQARASQAGCDGVLAKPFEPQLVIGRVKDLLARGRNAAGSSDASVPPAVAPAEPPASATVPSSASAEPPLDDYFDRLDAAFSTLNPPAPPAPPAVPVAAPEPAAAASVIDPTDIDWFGASPSVAPAEPWDLPAPAADVRTADFPLTFASPEPPAPIVAAPDADTLVLPPPHEPDSEATEIGPARSDSAAVHAEPPEVAAAPPAIEPTSAPAAPMLPPAVPAAAMPSLGDAFAALLAAEQSDASVAEWPGVTAAQPAAAPVVTDAMIDDVVRRVLDRMSDAVVRETTAAIVSTIAERLVRDEIERIKASVK